MLRYAAALILLPALCLGQETVMPLGRSNPAVFRAPFNAGAASFASPVDSFGQALTFTRASTATYLSGSTVTTAASGALRVEAAGLREEYPATNLVIRSEALDNAAWTATNVTVTANAAAGADGATTAEQLAGTAGGGLVESTAWTAAAAAYELSLWAKGASQSFDMVIRDTTAGSDLVSCTKTATATLTRFSCLSGAATAGHSLSVRIFPGGAAGTGTLTAAWGVQAETSIPASVATSYIPTTSAAVTRAEDALSVANPLALVDTNWCVSAVLTPDTAWSSALGHIWAFGSCGSANSSRLFCSGGSCYFEFMDNSTADKTITYDPSGLSAGAHTVTACMKGTTQTLYVDGASVGSSGGAGAGTWASKPTSLYLDSCPGSYKFIGNVKNIAVCRTADPARCL